MPNSSSERLADLLGRLVGILGGTVEAATLREVIAGRGALVTLDDAWVRVEGDASGRTAVRPADPGDPDFACTAREVHDLVRGARTLDAVLVDRTLRVRGDFRALRAMFALVVGVLGAAAVHPPLRALWEEFEATWPVVPAPVRPLSGQLPRHARLLEAIPLDVLLSVSRAR